MRKILIIEDDEDIAAIERDYLIANGFSVEISNNGKEGMDKALAWNFDLILLDIMLPGIDGFSICRKLREKIDTPIFIVSAKREDVDKIRGLGLGADDYIEKPFSPSVLVAKIKNTISRYESLTNKNERKMARIQIGDIVIDTDAHKVFVKDKEITLAKKEFELLLFLMTSPDMVFSRETLYEYVWGMDSDGDSATVAVHINRLREKIEENPISPHYIQTVWGTGYMFSSK